MSTTISREHIDLKTLHAAVCALLDDSRAVILEWECSPLSYDTRNPISGGLVRVHGRASASGIERGWSLIVKGVRPAEGVDIVPGHSATDGDLAQPERFNNWEREVLAYRSGVLAALPPGLEAARCLAIEEVSPTLVQLWLEEIMDPQPSAWGDAEYGRVARRIGQFNGAYLTGAPLPDQSWLAYGWLPSLFDLIAGGIRDQGQMLLQAALQHPLFRDAFGEDIGEHIVRLLEDGPGILDGLARLPRVLCHRDAFPANLFLRDGSDAIVAIDWANVGIGPVGEELAPLVTQRFAGRDFQDLEAVVMPAYLDGLTEAGWDPDERLVRFGYAATAVLRYLLGAIAAPAIYVLRPEGAGDLEARRGKSVEQFVYEEAEMAHYLLGLFKETCALL